MVGISGLRLGLGWSLPVVMLCGGAVHAQEDGAQSTFLAEWGFGHERTQAPTVILQKEPPYAIAGPDKTLSARVGRLMATGSYHWPQSSGTQWSASWQLVTQQTSAQNALGYAVAGGDLRSVWLLDGASLGVGLAQQDMWSQGQRFRRSVSVDADWTKAKAGAGFWSLNASLGTYRHPAELKELDSQFVSVGFVRRWLSPVAGLDSADLDVGWGAEHNIRAIDGLSNRRHHVRLATERKWGAWTAYGGVSRQSTRYQAGLEAGESPRKDAFTFVNFGLMRDLGDHWSLRLATTSTANRANLPLYLQHSRGWSMSWVYSP